MRSTTAPWRLLSKPLLGGVLPVIRTIITVAGVMSPLRLKWKLPRMPFLTSAARSSLSTDARVPSERAIACSTSSAA